MIAFRAIAPALVLAFASGCEAVPALTFQIEAGPDAADAAVIADDGTMDASCPQAPPSGASVCCGVVPCNGLCASQCDACTAKCGPGELCCAKTNNVVCVAAGTLCH